MFEMVEFMARSPTRIAVMKVLADADEPVTQRDIHEEISASRSTLGRTLDQMAAFDWIIETPRGYRLSAFGAEICREFESFIDSLQTADEYSPLLGALPSEVLDFDLGLLEEAEITEATPSTPLAPVERAIEIRQSSDSVRELTPVLVKESTRRLCERITRGTSGETVEIVVPADVLEHIRDDPQYAGLLEPLVDSETARVYAYPGDIPWLLSLLDGCILFGTFDDDGRPVALIETDHPEIITWAESRYETYLNAADHVSHLPPDMGDR